LINSGEIILQRATKKYNSEIDNEGKAIVIIPPGKYELLVNSNNDYIAKHNIDIKSDKSLTIVTTQESSLHTIVTFLGIILVVSSIFLFLWKRNVHLTLNLLTIGFIIIALVSPWWFLNGNVNDISTNTKTLLIPSKIITLTSSHSIIGGEISIAPPELSMVLDILAIILVSVCILLMLRIFLKNRLIKISKIILISSILFLVLTVLLFYFAMSQVTDVGVGCFSGSGNLDISIPGLKEHAAIICNWGPGIGFYLCIIATICILSPIIMNITNKIKSKIIK
jgi:hypothetical protein